MRWCSQRKEWDRENWNYRLGVGGKSLQKCRGMMGLSCSAAVAKHTMAKYSFLYARKVLYFMDFGSHWMFISFGRHTNAAQKRIMKRVCMPCYFRPLRWADGDNESARSHIYTLAGSGYKPSFSIVAGHARSLHTWKSGAHLQSFGGSC